MAREFAVYAEIARIKARLENLFQFAEATFADGQELLTEIDALGEL